jgi:hypothetical protein
MVALYHKEYVPAYLRCLQQNKQGGDETIVKLDAQLDENVILLFRRMAHAKFKAMQKATASAAEAAGKQQKQQQGWVGWLMGTNAQRPSQQAAKQVTAAGAMAAAGGAGAAEVDMTLGPEEWNKLEELVTEQAVSERVPAGVRRRIWVLITVDVGKDVLLASPHI